MTPADTQEIALMKVIRATMGPKIDAAFSGSPIAPAFVAALVANESDGNPFKTRYEAAEVGRFAEVLAARVESYQGISNAQLTSAIFAASVPGAVRKLIDLCTSWGPMQIMGWQAIKGKYALDDLQLLDKHFFKGYALLRDFQIAYPRETGTPNDSGWRALFTCWNAGSPFGKTTDPNYADRGLMRMRLYGGLA
jgi:hypothetical protein